jgi:hypothetical protein
LSKGPLADSAQKAARKEEERELKIKNIYSFS